MAFYDNTLRMRFLKKMLLAIAAILALACLKILFIRLFPSSSIFHYNVFSSLQFLLLLWAVFTGILETLAWTGSPPRKARIRSLTVFLLLVALGDLTCTWLLYHPGSIPAKWRWGFEYYYANYQRNIMQYDKKLATYDTSLFYRWKAGNRGLFRNFEFSDSVFTNDMGFRNKQISMDSVKLICLGDSYTVGWGVGQEEAYPQQLEKIIKEPVLNTGVSSYGTAREVESIRHLDTRNVDRIIIEYSNNDAEENEAYLRNNYRLLISPQRVYDSICNEVKWSTVYFPGKCICTLGKLMLGQTLKSFAKDRQAPDTTEMDPGKWGARDARTFIEVLKRSGWNFDKLQVIVFNIDQETDSLISFVPELSRQLDAPENKYFFKDHLHLLSIAGLLTPADRYVMDPHLRPSGQKKIAQALAQALNALHPISPTPSGTQGNSVPAPAPGNPPPGKLPSPHRGR